MLIEKSLKDFNEVLASKSPTPGGGSVAALAGAIGASLTQMVGNLTIGKKAYKALEEDLQKQIDTQTEEAQRLMGELNDLVDEDTKSFDKVMEAMKLPKETEEEKAARRKAIEAGTVVAMETPLKTAKTCLEVLKLQKLFAEYGNKNAITDVGVGALMAYSGVEGAALNVKINLGGLSDADYVAKVDKEVVELIKEANEIKEEIMKTVYSKL